MQVISKGLIVGMILMLAGFLSGNGAFAAYPEKPITIAVGFSAGGSTDQICRAIGAVVEKSLGQPVVVINKPGGGGTIAASWVKTKRPDGYNLVAMTPAVIVGELTKKVPYDIVNDFTHIMRFSGYVHGIGSKAGQPWNDLKGFIDYAKKNPGKLTAGAPGKGSLPYLAVAQLSDVCGIKLKQIPYKGGTKQMAAMLGGHLDTYNGPLIFLPHVDNGAVNFLAIYADERLEDYPDVPTVRDVGYDVIAPAPLGISAPANLPAETLEILQEAFKKAMQDPSVIKTCKKFQMPMSYEDSSSFSQTVKQTLDYYGAIAVKIGMKIQ